MKKKEGIPLEKRAIAKRKYSVGSPPMYSDPKKMQKKIQEYFEGGFSMKTYIVGNKKQGFREVLLPKITITDLVIYLGFESRQSFYDYEKKENFAYTIKRARTFIEREYEEMLDLNPTGAIFALKNFGWTDKQEHELYGKDGNPILDLTKLSDEDLAKLSLLAAKSAADQS